MAGRYPANAVALLVVLVIFCQPIKAGLLTNPLSWIGDAVDDILGPSIDDAAKAVRKIFDEIFDKKIGPLVDKINAALNADIDKVNEDVQELEQKLEKFINATIEQLFEDAKSLVGYTIDQIEKKLIDRAFDRADELERQAFNDLRDILNKLDKIVNKIDCAMQATEKEFEQFLLDMLYEMFPDPLETCRAELAKEYGFWFRFTPVAEMNNLQRYQLEKCRTLQPVQSPDTPIAYVCRSLLSVETLAMYGRCGAVAIGAPDVELYYLKERIKISQELDAFQCSTAPTMLSDAELSNDAVGSASPSDCGTPLECIAKAITAVHDALKEMKEMDERFKNEIAKLKASDRDLSLQIATISSKFNTTVEGINSRENSLQKGQEALQSQITAIQNALAQTEQEARKGHCIIVGPGGSCPSGYSGAGSGIHANNGWFGLCCVM